MVWNDTSSLYTPRCKDFNAAFKGMPGITTHATEISRDYGTFADFDGAVYINHREWVAITAADGKFMVYINNPGCPVDADVARCSPKNTHNNNGCSVITNLSNGH